MVFDNQNDKDLLIHIFKHFPMQGSLEQMRAAMPIYSQLLNKVIQAKVVGLSHQVNEVKKHD